LKLTHPEIATVFDTDIPFVNTIVIESPEFLCRFLSDITSQCNGDDGKTVLSDNNKLLAFDKFAEYIDSFIPFDINRKSLITKITSAIEKSASGEAFYLSTLEHLSQTERFLNSVSFDIPCSLVFPKLSIGSIIKATGVEIVDDYNSLGEKLIDFFELTKELDRKKLFILFNLRSFMSDDECILFLDTVLSHEHDVIMMETSVHPVLEKEKRTIIDADLCEIC